MTTYNFDREIDRKNTNSLKYDFAVERGRDADVLPLWVADMDFQAPKPVLDALQNAVSHGIFGYSEVKGEYFDALYRWFDSRFDWQPKSEWLVKTPGVVFALAMAVRALTKEGDSVLIQPPVYYPFFEVIRDNNRKIVESPLLLADGHYEIDFDDLEEKIASQNVKLFLLCSPHNPVGRVWTKEELQKLGELCDRYHVFVVADEIHCDFAFPEHPHTIFAKACPQLEENMILCTAPSKTFNLAGLQVSNIWVPGKEVRDRFKAEINAAGYSQLNALGLIACQAAYENGGEWLEQCQAYLRENLKILRSFLRERLPKIRLIEPEGTYFAWLDCSGLGLSDTALENLIAHQAKLWLDGGSVFDKKSGQFERIVLACTKKTLLQALTQLEAACRGRNS